MKVGGADPVERTEVHRRARPEMAGIEGDAEIRAAALPVRGVDRGVAQGVGVGDRGDHVPARGETQHADLSQSLAELLDDIWAGRKQLKVYRQMKMYNDPTLNPYLYRSHRLAS